MTVTAIVGAQWGSEGKGVVAAAIAPWFRAAVRTGGPNAGHTFRHQGIKHVMRGVPCAAWTNDRCELVVGAGAVVNRGLLIEEMEELPAGRVIYLDRHAAVVPPEAEAAEHTLVRAIGSTAEGVGYTRIAKIKREDQGLLAEAYSWPPRVILADTDELIQDHLAVGHEVMLEGTQGSGLSLHHGPWPFVTSSDTNAAQLAADAGIAPADVEHVILVGRSFPIRVGGNSGPMGEEVDWSEIPGGPNPELTTVTRRQRRIARWSDDVVRRAVQRNRPCGFVLSFADYLDPALAGTTDPEAVRSSSPVVGLVRHIEQDLGVPVIATGTGGQDYGLVELGPCAHRRLWFRQDHDRAAPGDVPALAAG